MFSDLHHWYDIQINVWIFKRLRVHLNVNFHAHTIRKGNLLSVSCWVFFNKRGARYMSFCQNVYLSVRKFWEIFFWMKEVTIWLLCRPHLCIFAWVLCQIQDLLVYIRFLYKWPTNNPTWTESAVKGKWLHVLYSMSEISCHREISLCLRIEPWIVSFSSI